MPRGRRKGAGIGLAVAGLVCGIVALIPAIVLIPLAATISTVGA